MITGAQVVAQAREFLGTPFHHMGRKPGVGLDCAGLVICTARALGLVAANFDVPAYSRRPDGSLLRWCDRYMLSVLKSAMSEGDVIVLDVDVEPQHLGILTNHANGGFGILHAACGNDGKGRVIETRLMFSRAQRYVATYRLPGVG